MKIQKLWESYKIQVVPESAGENQIDETQKAFFAGGVAILSLLFAGTNPKDIEEELLSFTAMVGAKHATIN